MRGTQAKNQQFFAFMRLSGLVKWRFVPAVEPEHANQLFPATVSTQFVSCPAGGAGPKHPSTERSTFLRTFWS
jgi:hypothetical protein